MKEVKNNTLMEVMQNTQSSIPMTDAPDTGKIFFPFVTDCSSSVSWK